MISKLTMRLNNAMEEAYNRNREESSYGEKLEVITEIANEYDEGLGHLFYANVIDEDEFSREKELSSNLYDTFLNRMSIDYDVD